MICSNCLTNFLFTPWKVGIVSLSIIISLFSLFLLLRKRSLSMNQKLGLIYSHIFFLAFPFIFYSFYKGCKALFATCNQASPILIMLILTSIVTLTLGTIIGQLLFLLKMKRKSIDIKDNLIVSKIKKFAKKFNITNPKVYFIDSAKPFAFTYLKSKIFISIGLIELLNKKEIEAVILHEINHIQNRSSLLKFWTSFIRLLSPIAAFYSFDSHIYDEEIKADQFTIQEQRTNKHLLSAKQKIDEFYF